MMVAPPPVVYGAPPPTVVYGAPAPVMYGGGGSYGHHHGHRRRGSGGDMAEVAMGVGAGVLGGMILGDVLFD